MGGNVLGSIISVQSGNFYPDNEKLTIKPREIRSESTVPYDDDSLDDNELDCFIRVNRVFRSNKQT